MMSGKIRESATMKRIEKKRRAKRLRLARSIALGLAGVWSLASMQKAEAAITISSGELQWVSNEETGTSGYPTALSAAANGFTVTMTGGTINGNLYGGYSEVSTSNNTLNLSGGTLDGVYIQAGSAAGETSTATGNTINISGMSLSPWSLIGGTGGYSSGAAATKNIVNISNSSTVQSSVSGGGAYAVTNNEVNISDSAMDSYRIAGGIGEVGGATGNKVTISGSGTTVTYSSYSSGDSPIIAGGYNETSGEVSGNEVTIEGGTIGSHNSVYGGYNSNSGEGDVKNNTVTVSGGTINSIIFAGGTGYGSGEVSGNQLIAKGGEFHGLVKGGNSNGSGEVKNNTVTIKGGTFSNDIYGGEGRKGIASGNKVSIEGGTLGTSGSSIEVYGAYGFENSTSGNEVSFTGGTAYANLYGGYTFIYSDSKTKDAYANNNKVTIGKDVTSFKNVYGGYITTQYDTGTSSGDATDNTVTIAGGTSTGSVYGGLIDRETATGKVENNTVTVSGGTMEQTYGGNTLGSGDASANTVTITSGTVIRAVGGYSRSGNAAGNEITLAGGTLDSTSMTSAAGQSASGNATGNKLNLTSGTAKGILKGGWSDSGAATGNTVTLGDKDHSTVTLTGANIYGGQSSGGDAVTGNTLNVYTVGASAASVNNFDGYNFYLPTTINAGQSMLTLTTATIDLASAKNLSINLLGDVTGYKTGSYNLINGGMSGTTLGSFDSDKLLAGIINTAGYEGSKVTVSSGNLVLTLRGNGIVIDSEVNYAIGNEDQTENPPSATGDVSGYSIEVATGGTVNYDAYGGATTKGDVKNNTATISGGTVKIDAYGGMTEEGTADNNTLTISGGNVNLAAYGGTTDDGAATNNKLTMTGGTIGIEGTQGALYGGFAAYGNVMNNHVVISGGIVNGQRDPVEPGKNAIIGGTTGCFDGTRAVDDNSVTISGKDTKITTGRIIGGEATVNYYGTPMGSASAKGNSVTITGGTVETNQVLGGYVYAKTLDEVTDNHATISGGSVGADSPTALVGVYAKGSGVVKENTATLSGGTLTGAVVGVAAYNGAQATGNTATVSGGTLTGGTLTDASASYVYVNIPGAVVGGAAYDGAQATGNTVVITGGTIKEGTYVIGGVGNAADAFGNNVELSGTSKELDLSGATIYGSATYNVDTETVTVEDVNKKDNTLTLSTSGVTAKNIVNFQTINLNPTNLDGLMLTLTDDKTDISGATVNFDTSKMTGATGNTDIGGKSVELVHATALESEGAVLPSEVKGDYEYTVTADATSLSATIFKTSHNEVTVSSVDDLHKSDFAYSGYSTKGNANGNTLTIAGGDIPANADNVSAAAGYSQTGTANENKLFLNSGKVAGDVYGGYSEDASKETKGNEVTLAGTDVSTATVYGGSNGKENTLFVSASGIEAKNIKNFNKIAFDMSKASLTDTMLTLTDGATDLKDVTVSPSGSMAASGMIAPQGAKGVLLENANGLTNADVKGEWTTSGDYEYKLAADDTSISAETWRFKGNETSTEGKDYEGNVFGGRAMLDGNDATGNTLTVSTKVEAKDKDEGNAYGGYSEKGSATGNELTISASVAGGAAGGAAAGNVTGNTVNLNEGAEIAGNVNGGSTKTGKADRNTINVNGGTIEQDVIGGWTDTGSAVGNRVTVKSGTLKCTVTGGNVNTSGNAETNTVTISGGNLTAENAEKPAEGDTLYTVVAGATTKGDATKNILNIDGGTIAYSVSSGFTDSGAASENEVQMTNGTTIQTALVGGCTKAGTATKNIVTITGGKLTGADTEDNTSRVTGGYANGGDATENNVTVSGGTMGYIRGGRSKDNAATTNKVSFSGTAEASTVFGGYALGSGTASANEVTISGGTLTSENAGGAEDELKVAGSAIGGYSESGNATGNVLTITDGTMEAAYGGYAAGSGNANTNTVKMTGGTITGLELRSLFGGYSKDGSADNNEVYFNADSEDEGTTGTGKADEIFGGFAAGKGSASSNTVTVNGGEITGGSFGVVGGYSAGGTSNTNIVTIKDGTVADSVFGGYAEGGTAQDNTVTISGGELNVGAIIGGAGETAEKNTVNILGGTGSVKEIYGGSGTTTKDNTVNLGAADMTDSTKLALIKNAQIFGGEGDTSTGNTLNVYASGITAANVSDFQNLNFYLPEGFAAGTTAAPGDVALTLNGGEATNISNAEVGISVAGELNYKENDALWLIRNDKGVTADGAKFSALDDTLNEYDIEIVTGDNGNGLIGKIGETGLSEGAKSLTETRAAAMDFINMGGDMLVGKAIGGAVAAANAVRFEGDRKSATTSGAEDVDESDETEAKKSGGFTPFAAIGGSKQRAETGSHVDVRGWNFDLGFARAIESDSGVLTFGPFVEYGKGNYTSVINDGTKGFGDTSYTGIGFFVRQDQKSGLWLEASIRGGRTSSDYHGNIGGKDARYDIDNNYYGAHIGIGKINKTGDDAEVDLYGRLFYTNQASAHADVKVNDKATKFDFGSVNSTRLRLGARYTKHMNETNSFYAGLAYEYEFNGDADGTRVTATGKDSTGTPSLKGSSGMFELGWLMTPSERSPLTLDLGLTGWVGRRRGLGAHISMNWSL